MAQSKIELFNLNSVEGGIVRQLADGMTTTIFPGENAMLSVVRIDPHAMGKMHQHPEEQWGVMLEGSATRYQDDEEFHIGKGDIWRTPPNAMHTMKAGPDGAVVLDIFSPVRKDYLSPGSGFSAAG